MALSSSQVWEVRPSGGSDNNGGGFDSSVVSPGTDYSQQNSAQVAYTDLVIAATNTNVTSALNPFGSAHVGNTLQITGGTGFTTGFFTIKSVSGVIATLDRAAGTATSTGGTGNLGGALASLTAALIKASSAVAVPGNIIWLKGTQTITSTISWTTNSQGMRISLRGYGTSRGDSTHATIACSTNSVIMLSIGPVNGVELVQVDLTNTAGTPGDCVRAVGSGNAGIVTFQNCVISGGAIGINGNNGSSTYLFTGLYLIEVEIKNCTTSGMQHQGATIMKGCLIHNNTGEGVQLQNSASLSAYGCAFYSNGTSGLHPDPSSTLGLVDIQNCVFYSNTGDGIKHEGSTADNNLFAINNVFYGNGAYGINFTIFSAAAAVVTGLVQRNNAFGSNTSGARSSPGPAGISDVTLTANPFNLATSNDFSLNSTAGGGAALKAAGWQSAIA